MRHGLPALTIAGLLAAAPARADSAPGIVMSVSGETDPPLAAMSEIPANTAIQLQAGTKLTFLHYARCKLVTVSGGVLTLSRADYREEGKVESEADGPCPRVYALADTSEGRATGGIVSRGLGIAPRWPATPDVIFTGGRAAAVARAEILDEAGKPVEQLDIADRHGRLPQGAPALQPNAHYKLRLTLRGQAAPTEMPFVVTAPGGAGSLIVLRVD